MSETGSLLGLRGPPRPPADGRWPKSYPVPVAVGLLATLGYGAASIAFVLEPVEGQRGGLVKLAGLALVVPALLAAGGGIAAARGHVVAAWTLLADPLVGAALLLLLFIAVGSSREPRRRHPSRAPA